MASEPRRSHPGRVPGFGFRLIARQLWSDKTAVMSIFLAVFLTSLLVSSTPLIFAELSDEALQETLSAPVARVRNISVRRDTALATPIRGDHFKLVREAGERFVANELPESVQAIIDGQAYLADSPQFRVSAFPGEEVSRFDASETGLDS